MTMLASRSAPQPARRGPCPERQMIMSALPFCLQWMTAALVAGRGPAEPVPATQAAWDIGVRAENASTRPKGHQLAAQHGSDGRGQLVQLKWLAQDGTWPSVLKRC